MEAPKRSREGEAAGEGSGLGSGQASMLAGTSPLLDPSTSMSRCLRRLMRATEQKDRLGVLLAGMGASSNPRRWAPKGVDMALQAASRIIANAAPDPAGQGPQDNRAGAAARPAGDVPRPDLTGLDAKAKAQALAKMLSAYAPKEGDEPPQQWPIGRGGAT